MKRELPYERLCVTCGVSPAQTVSDDVYRCTTCQNEFELGRKLPSATYMVWEREGNRENRSLPIMGLNLHLLQHDEICVDPERTVSVRSLNPKENQKPWPCKILANHIPRFQDERDFHDPKYEGIPVEDLRFFPGAPKTFAHIGASAKEYDDLTQTYRGKPFLGLLKADVDFLGYIFSYGLRNDDKGMDRFTLSRLAQLSRMMDLYFTGYLQGIIQREFPDTYTIYAGGDDLLLIGPWRQMLGLTKRMRESFGDYTGHNPNITISAGLSLLHANHPVNRAVEEAEERLEMAKTSHKETKDSICAVTDTPMTWYAYGKSLENAEWIHEEMQGKNGVSTGFIYHTMKLAKDAEAVANGEVGKAGWRAKLAYHLARNINGQNKEEKNRKIANWLERLGLDNLFRMTKTGSDIDSWGLPITIALYRNRK